MSAFQKIRTPSTSLATLFRSWPWSWPSGSLSTSSQYRQELIFFQFLYVLSCFLLRFFFVSGWRTRRHPNGRIDAPVILPRIGRYHEGRGRKREREWAGLTDVTTNWHRDFLFDGQSCWLVDYKVVGVDRTAGRTGNGHKDGPGGLGGCRASLFIFWYFWFCFFVDCLNETKETNWRESTGNRKTQHRQIHQHKQKSFCALDQTAVRVHTSDSSLKKSENGRKKAKRYR